MAAWIDLNLAPAGAPRIERCSTADGASTYSLAWDEPCATIILGESALNELVARALVATSLPPAVDLRD